MNSDADGAQPADEAEGSRRIAIGVTVAALLALLVTSPRTEPGSRNV